MVASLSNRITQDIQRQSALADAISRTQTEISTGKKIQQASDAPVAAARVAAIRKESANDAIWQANLAAATALNDQAGGVMKTVSDRLAHAREVVVAGANGALSASDRTTISAELTSIAEELDSLAAAKASNGDPLFAAGNALRFRFGETEVFAPVPSRTDAFQVAGTDFAQVVRAAAAALSSGNAGSIGQSLTALDGAITKAADVAADLGVRGARMASISERLTSHAIDLAAERSGLEDTDLGEAIARLNQQTLTLDAARAAFARINRQTLFDLLT